MEPFWYQWSGSVVSMTIKNLPDELYQRLKESAAKHRRSINSEAIACLEQALQTQRVDADEFLAELRALQQQLTSTPLTEDILRQARDEGRS
jgi:plasmid stability protein